MRIPLRIQVFVPFASLLAATITAVSVAGAWRALQTADAGIHDHVRNAAQVLVAAEFPLTDAVLRQTRGLSGAEFVCVDETGRVRASSLPGDEVISSMTVLITAEFEVLNSFPAASRS